MTKQAQILLIALLVYISILGLDQYIKLRTLLASGGVLNKGVVFGLINNNNLGIVLGIICLAIIIYILIVHRIALLPFSAIAAGLTSNLIDRFLYKGVVDYWNFFNLFEFNLADLLIVTVIFLWLYVSMFGNKKTDV